jgi:putative aldouronate transport system substrate-binding protein
MNNLTKLFSVALILGLMAACSGKNRSVPQAQNSTGLEDDESAHYNFLIMQGKQFDVPEKNETLDFLNQKFNSTFEFMFVSRGANDYQNKLNLLIASDDLPDLIQVNDYSILTTMVEMGLIIPLDDLVDKYGQEMRAIRPPETWEPFIFNGKLYSLPNQYRNDGVIGTIREDWVKKLGFDIPKTIEEYENVIRAFTDNDPDNNSIKDTYGISGPNTPITSTFLPAYQYYEILPDQWVVKNDGTLGYGSIQPEMLDALKLINKWFRAGYIDPQFPLYNREKFEEVIGLGKFGSFGSTEVQRLDPAFDIGLFELHSREPDSHFIAYEPIISKTGKKILWTNDFRSIGYTMAISKKAPGPIRLMKLLNYAASEEGYLRIRYGIEGTHYTIDPDGTFRFTPEWEDINKRTRAGLSIQYSNMFRREWFDRAASKEVWDGVRLFDVYGMPTSPIFNTTEADIEYNSVLSNLRNESFTKMICSTDPNALDKMFADFCTSWLSSGGEEVTKQKNASYQAEGSR